jgi:RNA polymerase sigma-70 factor, ECF subfamily
MIIRIGSKSFAFFTDFISNRQYFGPSPQLTIRLPFPFLVQPASLLPLSFLSTGLFAGPMTSSQGQPLVSIAAATRLLAKAAAPEDWSPTPEQFQRVLEHSASHRFRDLSPNAQAVASYLDSLHVADLALACSCSAGNSAAWDHFVTHFRPELYRAARAIAGESTARELADSLYAELYGLREAEGQRNSLFNYFHGRSKLSTWLRAILAQRHVDAFRRTRNLDSIDAAESGEKPIELVAPKPAPDPEREKYLAIMQAALVSVLDSLDPRERLRLAHYYVDELTLAQIGKIFGEHEATVSRKLERTRQEIRRKLDAALLENRRLDQAQLRLCYEYARQEWPFDLGLGLPSNRADAVSAQESP